MHQEASLKSWLSSLLPMNSIFSLLLLYHHLPQWLLQNHPSLNSEIQFGLFGYGDVNAWFWCITFLVIHTFQPDSISHFYYLFYVLSWIYTFTNNCYHGEALQSLYFMFLPILMVPGSPNVQHSFLNLRTFYPCDHSLSSIIYKFWWLSNYLTWWMFMMHPCIKTNSIPWHIMMTHHCPYPCCFCWGVSSTVYWIQD